MRRSNTQSARYIPLRAIASAVFCATALLAQLGTTDGPGRAVGTRNALQLLDAKPGKAVSAPSLSTVTSHA